MKLFLLALCIYAAATEAEEYAARSSFARRVLLEKRDLTAEELLVGQYEEEVEDDEDLEAEEVAESDVALPDSLDWRVGGLMHVPLYQGTCGSCAWIAGTQTLEARIAIVSENMIRYSPQSSMNCGNKPDRTCGGGQPYAVNTIAKRGGVVAPEDEIPYTLRECEQDKSCWEKCAERNPTAYHNALREQFVVIAGTGHAGTDEAVKQALQDGPLTTCYHTRSVEEGERCSPGCVHANSIIGYTPDQWILQDSYGPRWGDDDDGTWRTTKGSICGNAIVNKAYFPRIFYDYDRANAYYTDIEGGVSEEEITFIDKSTYTISEYDTKNWGTAKNKCAYLGAICKGVVELSSGGFELVANFGKGSSGTQRAFRKIQMVVYLKNESTGQYLGINEETKRLTLVSEADAASFFTSHSRFISFLDPTLQIVGDSLGPSVLGYEEVANPWTLKSCNIYNADSGKSFDVAIKKKTGTPQGSALDPTSSTQRFDIGISGKWALTSSEMGFPLLQTKKGVSFAKDKKGNALMFQWNARQIMNEKGHSITSDMEFSTTDFTVEDIEKEMQPRDCIVTQVPDRNLAVEGGKVVISSSTDSRWTFEYDDI